MSSRTFSSSIVYQITESPEKGPSKAYIPILLSLFLKPNNVHLIVMAGFLLLSAIVTETQYTSAKKVVQVLQSTLPFVHRYVVGEGDGSLSLPGMI